MGNCMCNVPDNNTEIVFAKREAKTSSFCVAVYRQK